MIAEIVLEIEPREVQCGYYYLVPQKDEEKVAVGHRVEVFLGKRKAIGYLVALYDSLELDYQLRPFNALVDEEPLFSDAEIKLGLRVAKYYFCNPYKVFETMLPAYAKKKKEGYVELLEDSEAFHVMKSPEKEALERFFAKEKRLSEKAFLKAFSEPFLMACEKEKILRRFQDYVAKGGHQYETLYRLNPSLETKISLENAPVQKQIVALLEENGALTTKEISAEVPHPYQALKSLEKKEVITAEALVSHREVAIDEAFINEQQLTLNENQRFAVAEICAALKNEKNQEFLLHGVTGSGKTEVYIRVIAEALQAGKTALVLVPEITLTPQLIGRFYSVFGTRVGVMHSNMSDGERYDIWKKARADEVQIIIGVRSAVFAPLANLGIIIIDEEHENTYKQSEPDPRYDARIVAKMRMEMAQGVIVLGSATPSLESYWASQNGKITRLSLPSRANTNQLPEVKVVDMGLEFKKGNRHMFSQALQQAIRERLAKKEQMVLFMNRRGFATYVFCRECGYTMTCPDCAVGLSYHKGANHLKCHYCDREFPVPEVCPHCGSHFIRYAGSGTEAVEEKILELFPTARVCRMDSDTTRRKGSHQEILAKFKQGEYDILLGTQMVAKGLDIANITLVGALNADQILNLPDFRSSEKTFSLLTQVAGRAGRGEKKGEVIIQTYQPEHYAIQLAKEQDYRGFYNREIKQRETWNYPPFTHILRILVSDVDARFAHRAIQQIAQVLEAAPEGISLLGPAAAPIEKIKNRYRFHIVLKGDLYHLYQWGWRIRMGFKKAKTSRTYRLTLDLDPDAIL